jgi:hypothetical protein
MRTFLYSTKNIVGSLLALGGLALFFTGVIHAYWWAIVAGLYGVGAIASPANQPVGEPVENPALPAEALYQYLYYMVENAARGVPKDSLDCLRAIQGTLYELLPRLNQLRDRNVISPKDSFTVAETVRRYLPDALEAYLRLPSWYAQKQRLADGRTASQILLEQLRVLDSSLREIARNAFAGDAETLIANGRFLRDKFSEKLVFRP